MSTPVDYRAAVTKNFQALEKLYNQNSYPKCEGASFWKLGTAFDTMIDYLDVSSRQDRATHSFSRSVVAIPTSPL